VFNPLDTKSILSRADYEDYLVYLCFGLFGPERHYLSNPINKAYLDFSRTQHGLSKVASKDALHEHATVVLEEAFSDFRDNLANTITQEKFDAWHESVYQRLFAVYDEYGQHLFVGQAQKWINMTFKYIFTLFTLGEQRLSGFADAYPFCHVPLDKTLITRLARYSPSRPLSLAWSRLDDYDEYLDYQRWIRGRFVCVPLDVEFLLWLGRDVEITGATAG
jgi:hypothetical protein